ncbi:odorant receptor 49a-like [Uranotaenia lowii]|uniref:odorant receptor 49a-like n=1 Tax=Uranotaenia lowii TaxID=190385 RepID=UPI002478D622|nr:odorant receptor 49a-like [Uranotaenia lowii]
MLYNILPPIRSTLMYLNRDKNSSEPLSFITHMEQEFYGLDIHSNILHYWFFSTCAMSSYVVSTSSMVVQATLLYSACNNCYSLFKVVAIRLKGLSALAPEAVQYELGDIVSMHVDALRCIELLEKIVNLSALVQVICCSLTWCLMAVYLTNNLDETAINVTMCFAVATFDTVGMSILGEQLARSSTVVTDAICNFLWYEADLNVRRSLLRMLQRAQKPVGFSAAGFYFINIERFGKMAQTSYSVYVVMKDSL